MVSLDREFKNNVFNMIFSEKQAFLSLYNAVNHSNYTDVEQLELIVDVYNINVDHNQEIMSACKILQDYAIYVNMVRKYAKELPLEQAVEKAIEECGVECETEEILETLEKMGSYEFV